MQIERIHVRGRFEASRFDSEHRVLVVSVTDKGAPLVGFKRYCVISELDVLRLNFDDVDVGRYTKEELKQFADAGDRSWVPMHKFHAAQIPVFLRERLRDGVLSLLVHCEAGVSRSPSIAMAICDSLGLCREIIDWPYANGANPARSFHENPPNLHVYNLVTSAFTLTAYTEQE